MNITLLLHDGTELKAEIADYIATDFANELNKEPHLMFAFGDNVIQKHAVKRVFPTVEKTEEVPVS